MEQKWLTLSLDVLLVFGCHIMTISVRFQWVFKGLLNIFLSLYPALYAPKRLVSSVAVVFFEIIATLTRRTATDWV